MGSQGNLSTTQKPVVSHSSLPDSILQYQDYLRDVYMYHRYPKYSKPSEFPAVNRPEHPINLVLLHKERQIGTSHEQLNLSLHGRVGEILKEKTSIKIEEIGSTLKADVAAHFVLIEGAPGIGKSTLCWQLCRLWLKGKLQHEWDLVVLVEISDEAIRKVTSVYDLLYHPDDKIRKSLAQEIQKRGGEGLMVIFDGFNELSDDQRSEFSLVQRILSNRVLEKATIVVTSCPIAKNDFPYQFIQTLDEHIEIVGFNETDIQMYITLACKDNIGMLNDLRSYISSRPFILSVMYNPLHCTIVTELYIQYWQDGQKVFAPNTLTELYTALVLNLLRRSLPLNQSSNVYGLADLPTHVYKNLMQLAELAATGLKTKQYLYKNVPHDTLGLMVSVRNLYDVRRKKAAYKFLYLTLQEYLSALYWSQQTPQRQIEFLQTITRQNISDNEWMQLGLSMLYFDWPHLLFFAGLTKLDFFPFEVIMPVNNSEAMYIGPICQLLFETQSSQIVSNVFGHRRLEVNLGLNNHFDWFAIGYCIVNSDKTSSWNIPDVESPQELKLLSDGLHYFNWEQQSSSKLAINMTIRTSANEYFKIFPMLYPFTKAILHLNLSHPTYLDDDGFSVLQNLSHFCPNMQTLYLLLDFESFVFIESPRLPKETLVTIGLALPQFSVVVDSLHEYPKLRELHLYAKDR